MAIKRVWFFIFTLLYIGLAAFAQTPDQTQLPEAVPDTSDNPDSSDSASYFIRETEQGIRFIQRIDWDPVPDILKYEVIIDQRYGNSNRYNEVVREFTENPYIELSIPPGNYRYKVLVYNLLNRVDGESDYQYFEVFRAVQPAIRDISPHNIYIDEPPVNHIVLAGENFVLGAKVYLVPARENADTNYENQRGVITPTRVEFSDIGDTVELFFDKQSFAVNNYRVVVVNPGGLAGIYDTLSVKFQKPLDINVSAGYFPVIMGDMGNDPGIFYAGEDTVISPLGFIVRASLIPWKKTHFYFGFELAPFYNYVKRDYGSAVLKFGVTGINGYFLTQAPLLNNRLLVNLRLGVSITSFVRMHTEYENGNEPDDYLSTWFWAFQGGLSGQYFVYKKLFVELGIEMKFGINQDMVTTYGNMALTAGWQF